MSHESRHALASLMRSPDVNDALYEISLMIDEEITADEVDPLDLAMHADLDLDLDEVDARMVDNIYYFDVSACESLDDEIDALDR